MMLMMQEEEEDDDDDDEEKVMLDVVGESVGFLCVVCVHMAALQRQQGKQSKAEQSLLRNTTRPEA